MGGGSKSSNSEYLPQLVYVSREIRPGFQHNNKAGAMNALVRVSALLSNGAHILNLACNRYISNSRAFLEAMCLMMDPNNKKKTCYVQFPQRFDGIDANDRYANNNTIFYDVDLRGLDGIQGPFYVGTDCFFYRKALYGCDTCDPHFEPKMLNASRQSSGTISASNSHSRYSSTHDFDEGSSSLLVEELNNSERKYPSSFLSMKKCFGQSPLLILSNLVEDGKCAWSVSPDEILREAIHVISCDYEDNTVWGREVGWIYGSHTGDILTGFKMHARGWRSVYCVPACAAFKGPAPVNLHERLSEVLLWATGSIQILFSRHCPIWYGYGGQLKVLERIAYIRATIYPLASIPLLIYSALPAICLLTRKFIIFPITYEASIWIMLILLAVFVNAVLEIRWSDVSFKEWFKNQQFWLIAGVSSHFFAIFRGMSKIILGTEKPSSDDSAMEFFAHKWISLLILPTTLILVNLWGMVVGMSSAFTGYGSLSLLFAKLFFASCVVLHLHPFLRGLTVHNHQFSTAVVIWSILIAGMFSLLWIQFDPFTTSFQGPDIKACGIQC